MSLFTFLWQLGHSTKEDLELSFLDLVFALVWILVFDLVVALVGVFVPQHDEVVNNVQIIATKHNICFNFFIFLPPVRNYFLYVR